MIKVYIAGKLKDAPTYRQYREDWKKDGIDLHARWHDQAVYEEDNHDLTQEDFHIFWLVDEEDVKTADALILFGRPEDHLRGALVEAGIALGMGKLVIVVGDSPDYGTWQHHPVVVKAGSFEHAKTMILRRFR